MQGGDRRIIESMGPNENCINKWDDDDYRNENMPEYIGLSFQRRKWDNKLLYGLYKILRIFHVSLWYYFAPFIAFGCSYIIPYWISHSMNAPDECPEPEGEYVCLNI